MRIKLRLSGRPVSYTGPWVSDFPPPDHVGIFQTHDGKYYHESVDGWEMRWQVYIPEKWWTCSGCGEDYKEGVICDSCFGR